MKGKSPVVLKMKNGVRVRLMADFVLDFSKYGPSSTVAVQIEILDKDGQVLRSSEEPKLLVNLEEEETLVTVRPEQTIDIKIKPLTQ